MRRPLKAYCTTCLIRAAGVETVSRFEKGTSDSLPDTHNPLFAEAEHRTAEVAAPGA